MKENSENYQWSIVNRVTVLTAIVDRSLIILAIHMDNISYTLLEYVYILSNDILFTRNTVTGYYYCY